MVRRTKTGTPDLVIGPLHATQISPTLLVLVLYTDMRYCIFCVYFKYTHKYAWAYSQRRREGYQRPGAGQRISAPSLTTSIVKSLNKAAARGSGGALKAPPAGSGAEPQKLTHFLESMAFLATLSSLSTTQFEFSAHFFFCDYDTYVVYLTSLIHRLLGIGNGSRARQLTAPSVL